MGDAHHGRVAGDGSAGHRGLLAGQVAGDQGVVHVGWFRARLHRGDGPFDSNDAIREESARSMIDDLNSSPISRLCASGVLVAGRLRLRGCAAAACRCAWSRPGSGGPLGLAVAGGDLPCRRLGGRRARLLALSAVRSPLGVMLTRHGGPHVAAAGHLPGPRHARAERPRASGVHRLPADVLPGDARAGNVACRKACGSSTRTTLQSQPPAELDATWPSTLNIPKRARSHATIRSIRKELFSHVEDSSRVSRAADAHGRYARARRNSAALRARKAAAWSTPATT